MKGVALCVLLIGITGAITTNNIMIVIVSIVIGAIIGTLCKLDKGITGLGEFIEKKTGGKLGSITQGFVTASLLFCVGAMAIVGSIQDGLTGDYSMLTAKAILDFVIVAIMASTYGVGTMCSALAILVYQGSITIISHFAGNFISEELTGYLSYIGSALIFCVGINITFGKKIKVGNLLPALFIPAIYVFGKWILTLI
jgi:uncharacterized membrane protein YqgA involved in biofilm formation